MAGLPAELFQLEALALQAGSVAITPTERFNLSPISLRKNYAPNCTKISRSISIGYSRPMFKGEHAPFSLSLVVEWILNRLLDSREFCKTIDCGLARFPRYPRPMGYSHRVLA